MSQKKPSSGTSGSSSSSESKSEYYDTESGDKIKDTDSYHINIPHQELTVGEAVAAASAPPDVYHPWKSNTTTR